MISVGITSSSLVRYVEEHEVGTEIAPDTLSFEGSSADVLPRDWDVSDPEARSDAAEEQLGEGVNDDDWYAHHAQWFINPTLNAAVLIVYRPKVAHAQ